MNYSSTYTYYEGGSFEISESFSQGDYLQDTYYEDNSYKRIESFSQGDYFQGEADEESCNEFIVVFQSCYGTYLARNGEQISLLSNDGSIPDNAVWKFRSVRVKGGKYLDLSSPQNAYFHRAIQKLLNTYHPYDDWNLMKLRLKWTKQQMKTVKGNAAPRGRLGGKCVKGKGPLPERKIWLKPEADGSIIPSLMVFSNELSEEYFWSVQVFKSKTELQLHNSKSPPIRNSSMSLGNQQTANQERRGICYPGPNTGVPVSLPMVPSEIQNVQTNQQVASKDKRPNRFLGENTSLPVSTSVTPRSARHNFQTNQQAATQEMNLYGYPGSEHANNSTGSYPHLQERTYELVANDSPLFPVPISNHEITMLSASKKSCTKKSVTINNYGLNGSRNGAGSAGNVLHSTVDGNINNGKYQIIEGVNIQTSVKNEQNIFINFPNN